jgi:hypothetical protein
VTTALWRFKPSATDGLLFNRDVRRTGTLSITKPLTLTGWGAQREYDDAQRGVEVHEEFVSSASAEDPGSLATSLVEELQRLSLCEQCVGLAMLVPRTQ